MTCQILGLLLNTLTGDEEYPRLKIDTLMIPIQMQLSQKQKSFSQFFPTFLKSILDSKYFEKKDDRHRLCNFEITDSKNEFE